MIKAMTLSRTLLLLRKSIVQDYFIRKIQLNGLCTCLKTLRNAKIKHFKMILSLRSKS